MSLEPTPTTEFPADLHDAAQTLATAMNLAMPGARLLTLLAGVAAAPPVPAPQPFVQRGTRVEAEGFPGEEQAN